MRELTRRRGVVFALALLVVATILAGIAFAMTYPDLKCTTFSVGAALNNWDRVRVDRNGNATFAGAVTGARFNDTRLYWCDDFMETAALLASTVYSKAHWTGGGTNGTQTVTAGVGGTIALDTTNTGSRTSTLAFATADFSTNYAPTLEFRLKTSNITNTKITAGWYVGANDYAWFMFDTATSAANIYLSTRNNGATAVTTDTGVDLVAGTYYTFRLAIAANETVTASINGVRVAASHAGTVQQLATDVPYFYVDNKAASEAKVLTIDYVKVWQNRS